MSLGSYGRLAAEVYDIDKPIGHSFGDVEFYSERLRSCAGPILEPAVGTGRVLIPLLEAGLTVEGVDGSPEMLAVCRARCAQRGLHPVLHEGDMRTLSLSKRYEAVIVPAGSFLLIERREESIGVLRRFRDHLVPGGRLIVDIELQTEFTTGAVSTSSYETLDGETITLERKLVEVDFLEQVHRRPPPLRAVARRRAIADRDAALRAAVVRGRGVRVGAAGRTGSRTWWSPPPTSMGGGRLARMRSSRSRPAARKAVGLRGQPPHGERPLDLDLLPPKPNEAGPRGGQVVPAHDGWLLLPTSGGQHGRRGSIEAASLRYIDAPWYCSASPRWGRKRMLSSHLRL